jgi:RecA-family ATPase
MTVLAINNELDAIALRQDRKSKFLLYRELEATSRKEWLVQGWLGSGDASAWYGIPGCGKSAIAQDMALHVAGGQDWHGRPVKRGAVLYVALERKMVVARRAIAYRERHGIEDLPFAIVGGVFDLRTPAAVAELIAVVREIEHETGEDIVLIVIDTISRALSGGDENSPKDMGAIVAATSKLQADTKAHVLWVHHMPQDGAERLRGHGALLGAMDTTIHVEKGDINTATVIKANDSEEGERMAFILESVTIGPETTAPVVVQEDAEKAGKSSKTARLRPRARRALEALTETILAHGQPAPINLALPPDIKTVTLDQWREELFTKNVMDRNGPNPRTDFSRLLDQLASKQVIGTHNNLVWKV